MRVLIVEDEMLIAMEMADIIEELGLEPIGIAPDASTALSLAEKKPDIALVDLNLRDGLTGPQIGHKLTENDISVIFITANPRLLGNGIPGTLGVMEKPCLQDKVVAVIDYARKRRSGKAASPPPGFVEFRN